MSCAFVNENASIIVMKEVYTNNHHQSSGLDSDLYECIEI